MFADQANDWAPRRLALGSSARMDIPLVGVGGQPGCGPGSWAYRGKKIFKVKHKYEQLNYKNICNNKNNSFSMVFKIFRNLSHLFSCHVLITIQWGRQSRCYDLRVAVEGTEVWGGWRSWSLLDSRWAGPGPPSFASWPRHFLLDMTDESSHEAKDPPVFYVAMILGLNICQTSFWRRKKIKIHSRIQKGKMCPQLLSSSTC